MSKRAPDPFPTFTRTGVPDEFSAIDKSIADGAEADRLIERLQEIDRKGVGAADGLTGEDIRFVAYAAVVFRVRRDTPLSEGHLRLLAAALGIERAPPGIGRQFGIAPVENHAAFIAAADVVARDTKISKNKLAMLVGVSRRTIDRWLKMPEFQRRAKASRELEMMAPDIYARRANQSHSG